MYYELTDAFAVAATPADTWSFFSDANNLPAITPPWMNFRIVRGGQSLAQDSVIDYTIRWAKLPVKWRTRIIDWTPPRQFIDLQIRGPYTLWHHQHRFEPLEGTQGTHCSDRVIYKLPVPLVGPIVHAVVRRQLLEIFRYRRKVIGETLGLLRSEQDVTIRTIG